MSKAAGSDSRSDRADDARRHARERRAVARGDVLDLPPSGGAERRALAGSRAGAGIIGADARPNWREQPARESLSGVQWRRDHQRAARGAVLSRALRMLTGSPLGCRPWAAWCWAGLATSTPGITCAGGWPIKVTWLAITDAGRGQALAGALGPREVAPALGRVGPPGEEAI